MIIEIILGVSALAFVILVIFLILALRDARRTLKKADRMMNDVHKIIDEVSEPSVHLIQNLNKLTLDIKKKSEGIDLLFRPFYGMQKGDHGHDSFSEIVGCISCATQLFRKIKKEVTR
jgi:uncharacterized protein YoxC